MKLATIRLGDELRAARVSEDKLTVLDAPGVGALLDSQPGWREVAEQAGGRQIAIEDADFAPVIAGPSKIICVGINYGEHAREANRDPTTYPTLFAKYSEALIGAYDDVWIPAVSGAVDWEAELTIVIGKRGRHLSEADAPEHIAGYTVANDISIRDWQRRTSQYLQGKTFEHTTPVGPYLVSSDAIDASDLRVLCKVDDEVVQDFSTAEMIFPPAYLVSYISHVVTLEPGDLILTGTGPGVGVVMDPPRFVASASTVVTEIEGIGRLENTAVSDPTGANHLPDARRTAAAGS